MAYEYTRENDLWEDVCVLVKYKISLDENLVVQREAQKREVFCQVGSIYEKEFMDAQTVGISAQWKIVVFAPDYEGETEVEYDGARYAVYRKYRKSPEEIELYLRDDLNTLDLPG